MYTKSHKEETQNTNSHKAVRRQLDNQIKATSSLSSSEIFFSEIKPLHAW